jgi:hypothetical protein
MGPFAFNPLWDPACWNPFTAPSGPINWTVGISISLGSVVFPAGIERRDDLESPDTSPSVTEWPTAG